VVRELEAKRGRLVPARARLRQQAHCFFVLLSLQIDSNEILTEAFRGGGQIGRRPVVAAVLLCFLHEPELQNVPSHLLDGVDTTPIIHDDKVVTHHHLNETNKQKVVYEKCVNHFLWFRKFFFPSNSARCHPKIKYITWDSMLFEMMAKRY
jgi:hypothetical protein